MLQPIEARDENDADSSIGDDVASSTTSVSSSILEYRKFQGRTYHSEKYNSEYFAPNDERQRDSMDISHHSLTLLLDGKLFLAPLKEGPKAMLDIGTGTGIWAIDFADEYPEAEVIGTDLSPIQPSWVPPNVKFELEDATNTWSWPDNYFDFIHIRYLIGAIADWGALFKEAFRCCKSGSYFESVEVNPLFKSDDESINNIAPIQTWNKICRESEKAFGRSLCEVENDTQLLGEVGFVDLQVTDFKVPVGGWAKDTNLQRVGQFHRAGIENDLQGYTLMTWQKVFGSPGKEYQLFLMQMRQALRDKNVHGYMRTPDENCSEIPSSLVNALVELYFNNVYQSNLLLHKDSFIKSLADSAVQPHVLLSMCALGANGFNLESELRRRRVWACYLMHCFSSEKLFRFEAIADIEELPLPWPDDNFEAGAPPSDVATIANGVVTGSVFAELIRGLHLWSHVSPIVRCKETALSSRIQQIFTIEDKLLTWWANVPLRFKVDASANSNVYPESLPKILLINFVYHQSLCALHSSIVPLFCWSKGDTSQSSARQLSAQIAFEHAGAISILTSRILSTSCSLSAMPIFVAYAAYSSCAIQIPFLWCSEPRVRAKARSNVELNMGVIEGMSSYWKLASLLQVYVRCIYDVHKSNPPRISNEPRYTDFAAFSQFGVDSDLAKASILEFTRILRSGESGYVKPGEESRNLITSKASMESSAQVSISGDASLDQMFQGTQPDISTMTALDSQFTDFSSSMGNEWPVFDVFNSLCEADITSLFFMDDNVDLASVDTDFIAQRHPG
ncbi:unnamed protein product [Fusarium graminearum]|uniref:Uncharacterized protein n=1 Tax=Gibberella zeae TaxID=5518 RepID=A0A8H3JLV5_GIBZA|nr:unnamed protein product [Fusarium graminearum]CAG1982850.1 unnamed protein product [Fusarium graminearum]CAG2004634.1 unnamed protein product [Fusarium graminearum]